MIRISSLKTPTIHIMKPPGAAQFQDTETSANSLEPDIQLSFSRVAGRYSKSMHLMRDWHVPWIQTPNFRNETLCGLAESIPFGFRYQIPE